MTATDDDINKLLRQLQRLPAVQEPLVRGLDGRARIDGVASPIDLARDTKAILAAHPSGHVHASNVHFLNDVHLDARNEAVIRDAIEVAMAPEGPYRIQLSHVVLHHSASLPSMPARPSGSFGTLVVFYASTAVGGDMTASLDGASVHCPSPHVAFLAFDNGCDVAVAPITKGARAMLVFDLIYRDATAKATPPSVASLLTAAQVAATRKRQKTTLRAQVLRRHFMQLTTETLEASENLLVERLARTGCWDVALALVETRQRAHANRHVHYISRVEAERMYTLWAHGGEEDDNGEDRDEEDEDDDDDDDGDHDDRPVDCITACIMIASNALPPVFTHVLDNKPLLSYVDDINLSISKLCLVFWPKQHRLRLLGFRASLRQLDALVIGASTDLYGYASIHAFADAVVDMVDSDVSSLSDNADVPDAARLGRVLLALGDVPLLQALVATIHLRDTDAPLQALLVTMLRHYGWPTFDASIITLLRRPTSELLHVRHGAGLVAACLPLKQPYMREFLVAAYHALLQQLSTFENAPCSSAAATPLLRDMLLIEAHLNRTRDDDQESMYLGARLPLGVVHHISSFLCPGALADMVCHRLPPWVFDPIRVLAPGIRGLRNASVYRAVIDDAVKRVLQISARHDDTNEGWADVLALHLEAATVDDDDLCTRFFATCRPAIGIETIHSLATQCPDTVAPRAVRTSLVRYLVPAVTALVTDNDDSDGMVTLVSKAWAVLEAFDQTDAGLPIVRAVHERWRALETRTKKVAFTSHVMQEWFPVVVTHPHVLRPLLGSMLPVLEAYMTTRRRPTPLEWALPSVYFACDCEQCTAAQSFVADATRGIFSLHRRSLCMHLLARVQLPSRRRPFPDLAVRMDDEGVIELCKAGAKKLRRYERLCSDVDRMRAALQDEHHEPLSKRRRHDDGSAA
ncbi:hypothetical protein SPRG_05044 [Saprolegnia parasitica CBS 223.65]|uniref:Uncharacterized protein n=1 Tax=Saprolegnia parasitica (strain CBS 223.65) TaxID=695850 RepID=A0A067CIJ7_SAPPC|nr:hypothetical protein SPRG_05044 [Saprolegnia parasitica CBS 223.65]KDO30333.1 hypothetical protein SPRG_05044 [Saprolegnia parasitica CBS 223.65]|eukprot:XP_012198943.1 hypothetical protein SPRG_05044 [Saprolegnia parasitica CBS 223.65]